MYHWFLLKSLIQKNATKPARDTLNSVEWRGREKHRLRHVGDAHIHHLARANEKKMQDIARVVLPLRLTFYIISVSFNDASHRKTLYVINRFIIIKGETALTPINEKILRAIPNLHHIFLLICTTYFLNGKNEKIKYYSFMLEGIKGNVAGFW